ncbi:MBL fold metallo-hydrolase [Azospirillum sp. B4]|uniref:MBL fold metallo-hydrolase n=1 Tax=Azospirillum sp. B4 TaxID=95605 RepID=UPI0005C8E052|nr:MBL fold metallo-hydrolase [Azospirillum sp. B4]
MGFTVTFWGVRGTVPCPMASHLEYGGNTSCIEVTAGRRTLVLDAGTGLRSLGKSLRSRGINDVTLLLTHTHIDHINGFPFFEPCYSTDFSMRVMAGHCQGAHCIQSVMEKPMDSCLFPVPLQKLRASLVFEDFRPGATLDLGDGITVRTAPLNHPGGGTGYRIEYDGRSFCYVTDTEHDPDRMDANVLGLIQDADLVAYDCSYTDEEFAGRRGWGHSTWREGVRLARAAGVGRLCLFHHDPDHDDVRMKAIEAEAQQEWPRCFAAREGLQVDMAAESAPKKGAAEAAA